MNKEDLKKILYNFKSEIQEWESQLEGLSRLDSGAPHSMELNWTMVKLYDLQKALSEHTLEYSKKDMESIQKDIDRVTSIYADKLELLGKEARETDDLDLDRLGYMQDILHALSGIRVEVLGMEQKVLEAGEKSWELYSGQVAPRPEREGVFNLSSMFEYALKLDVYVGVQDEQRLATVEDAKAMKASVDNALRIMEEVGPKAREHIQGIQAKLKSVQESIDTVEGNIKEINEELSSVFQVSLSLRNVMSRILRSVSKAFVSEHDDLQESKTFKAQGKGMKSQQDLRNEKITLREDLANKKAVLAELDSELEGWNSLSNNFRVQISAKIVELASLSKELGDVLDKSANAGDIAKNITQQETAKTQSDISSNDQVKPGFTPTSGSPTSKGFEKS